MGVLQWLLPLGMVQEYWLKNHGVYWPISVTHALDPKPRYYQAFYNQNTFE